MNTATTRPPPATEPAPGTVGRMLAALLAAAVVVALVIWVPFVDGLREPCGGGIAAQSCRQPPAVLRWGQYVAGIITAILGVVAVGALALYAVRRRWLGRSTTVVLAFVVATAVWVVLYLLSLPSLI